MSTRKLSWLNCIPQRHRIHNSVTEARTHQSRNILDSSADPTNSAQHRGPGNLCAAPRSRNILDSAEVAEKFGQRRKPSKYCTPRSQACKVWASATAGSKSFGRRDRKPKVLDSATLCQQNCGQRGDDQSKFQTALGRMSAFRAEIRL